MFGFERHLKGIGKTDEKEYPFHSRNLSFKVDHKRRLRGIGDENKFPKTRQLTKNRAVNFHIFSPKFE